MNTVVEASARFDAIDMAASGQFGAAAQLCRRQLLAEPDGRRWLTDAIVSAMERPRLDLAGNLALIHAALERGSKWYPSWIDGVHDTRADVLLSLPKLRHDLAQLRRLRERNLLDPATDELIAAYEAALLQHAGLGDDGRVPLGECDGLLKSTFGRLVHMADAPRVTSALSDRWSRDRAQRLYRSSRPEIVVIDNFLSEQALESLHNFCLESTVWTQNRYGHGRLGALFFNGFNCPLLLQIAEEIQAALADLIGSEHPLRQLWGFKNTGELPADSTIHADFAAINVNFWLTPESANLDPDSGGMVIYDLEAPLSWDFRQYNESTDLISAFIREHRPRVTRVPYRRNRAVIFNSDLFHATEAVKFQPDFESHRINVTMLFGDRQLDTHHREQRASAAAMDASAWRSAAFRRAGWRS